MIRIARPFAVLALTLGLAACGGEAADGGATKANTDGGQAVGKATAAQLAGVMADDMVLGAADAPVTIIEYASVTCPGCAAFHERIFPEIKEKFIDTGKVKFVFREFPTPPVEFALIGSVLARCAAEKTGSDGYFVVLNGLFQNQRAWIGGEDPKAELLKIAGQAGMDEPTFDACLKQQKYVDMINETVRAGSETFGVNSTPSFVIDGEKVSIRSAEDFETKLNELYAAASGDTGAAQGGDADADAAESDG